MIDLIMGKQTEVTRRNLKKDEFMGQVGVQDSNRSIRYEEFWDYCRDDNLVVETSTACCVGEFRGRSEWCRWCLIRGRGRWRSILHVASNAHETCFQM